MGNEILTYKLRNGVEVFAKMSDGETRAVGYANRTQADLKAAELGDDWYVYNPGRPFYVAKVKEVAGNEKPEIPLTLTTKEDYWQALGAVPPRIRTTIGFLVGEAYSIRKCRVTKELKTTYSAYFTIEGRYYDGGVLTLEEFKTVTAADLIADPVDILSQ